MDQEKRINIEAIERPFPKEKIRQRRGPGGKVLDYIETPEVIRRLNEVFGYHWSFEIAETIFRNKDVIVRGRLTANGIIKEQYGSSSYDNNRSLGDVFKAAGSDAIKKCATLFGIGLHLYDDEIEPQPEPAQPQRKPSNFDPQEAYRKCVDKFGKVMIDTELKRIGFDPENGVLPDLKEAWVEIWRYLEKHANDDKKE